jgi:predicted DNA-binding transcriptional regulator AlpA
MKALSTRTKEADLITSQVVADRLSISVRTLWRWVREGRIPEPIRVNSKVARVDDLLRPPEGYPCLR